MVTAAEIIARRLKAAGVTKAFGIPGGEVLAMIRALDEAGIAFVMAKHENAAGFMAEGAYHASGAPGVLVATIGPGAANAVNFIVNALQDRVPVIYITGRIDPEQAATYTHQVFDHKALLSPITKASIEVTSGAVDEIVDKAVAIAMDDPPGPVHIDLPISVASAEQPERKVKQRVAVKKGVPSSQAYAAAQQWFAAAERPVLVAGLEVLYQQAEKPVADFCKRFSVPIVTTYKGKGILSEDHDLSLGGAGLSPKANRILMPFMQQADLVILAGYDPIEMRSEWRNPWPETTKIIELAAVPNTHFMHQADISFVCDVGGSIQSLGQKRSPDQPSWQANEVGRVKSDLARAFLPEPDWGPAKLIQLARSILPMETVATVDTGAHRILLSQMWPCYHPRSLIQSTALCTMGCALPLAVGYKAIHPAVPVVAFTGDAGLEMVLGDLATLRDLGQPVIVIVFVDYSLALIEMKQRAMAHKNVGVDSRGRTDFVKVAQGFDMQAVWVDDASTFAAALKSALAGQKPTLLACRIGRKSYDGKI